MLGALEILAPLFGPKSGEVEGGDSQPMHVIEKLVPTWRKLARLTGISYTSLQLTLTRLCGQVLSAFQSFIVPLLKLFSAAGMINTSFSKRCGEVCVLLVKDLILSVFLK